MADANPTMTLDPKYDHYDYPTTSPVVQTGHPGHTTKEQEAQVHQLRMGLEQAGCKDRLDTLTLLRFLRARKFNVDLSKQMFLDCEKWRKEFGVEDLVKNFQYEEKSKVFEYYPQYYHKTDKDGRPVYIEQLGNVDLTAMYKITTADRMLQNLVVEYEKCADPRLPVCSRMSGQLVETCCTIMDLKGVGLGKARQVFGYVQQASGISQNYYPERLGKLYIINAPWGFAPIWNVVKGFLDPVTVQKIHVLGGGYQKELLGQVPAENLPKLFGGSCECDGGCMLSDAGPWKDPKWMKSPNTEKPAEDSTTIENGPAEVSKPGDEVPAAAPGDAPLPSGQPAGETAPAAAPAPAPAAP
ncbi:MAG: cytosolic factor, phosphatidylinositol/phosphatidylcholine transfer protein [Chaenotheca gracillima]|nr:MAG: cytosolic factor, phosphatidylinositol/phosphatidylcholine transfer protein [Chaenotheca gracillima]